MAQLPERASKPAASENEAFVPLAGARFAPSHNPAVADFRARITRGVAGHITLAHQLEGNASFLATCIAQ
jgi:hypothetical protein